MSREPYTYDLTTEEIDSVWGNANFGDKPKKEVILDALLQMACDYSTGYTAKQICAELGLVGKGKYPRLTKRGKRVMYWLNLERHKDALHRSVKESAKNEHVPQTCKGTDEILTDESAEHFLQVVAAIKVMMDQGGEEIRYIAVTPDKKILTLTEKFTPEEEALISEYIADIKTYGKKIYDSRVKPFGCVQQNGREK